MYALNPLHILASSCIEEKRQMAMWSLLYVDPAIRDKLITILGVNSTCVACQNFPKLLVAIEKVVNEIIRELPNEIIKAVDLQTRQIAMQQTSGLQSEEEHSYTKTSQIISALYACNVLKDTFIKSKIYFIKVPHQLLKEVGKDQGILLNILQSTPEETITFLEDELKYNEKFLLEAIQVKSAVFRYLPEHLKTDLQFILKIIKKNAFIVNFFPESVLTNKNFMLEIMMANNWVIKFLPDFLLKDRDFMLSVLRNKSCQCQYLADELKNDRVFMLEAIQYDPSNAKYASDLLKSSSDFMLEAIEISYICYNVASDLLKRDKFFLLEAVQNKSKIIKLIDNEFKNSRDFIFDAIRRNVRCFNYVQMQFKNDEEIAIEAIAADCSALRHVDKSLQTNVDFLCKAFKANYFIFPNDFLINEIIDDVYQRLLDGHLKEVSREFPEEVSSILEQILHYKDKIIQGFLVNVVVNMKQEDIYRCLNSDVFSKAQKEKVILLLLIVYSLDYEGKIELEKACKIHYKSFLKDTMKRNAVLNLFLHFNEDIHQEDKYDVLCHLLRDQKDNNLISRIHMISALCSLDISGVFPLTKEKLSYENLSFVLVNNLQENGIIPVGEHAAQEVARIFTNYRMPAAFFMYASHFLSDSTMKESLSLFVKMEMEGTFLRARHEANSHKEYLTPQQLMDWQTALPAQEIDSLTVKGLVKTFDVKSFLVDKLIYNLHGGKCLDRIKAYLENDVLPECLTDLEKHVVDLLTARDDILKKLYDVQNYMLDPEYEDVEFKNDISAAIKQLECVQDVDAVLIDTEDPQDLFLVGTEITGSCLRIDGNPDRNKGLMGYLLDGKIRLLAVKNHNGTIIARSIIKLLVDANKKPVLFIEPEYGDEKYSHFLMDFAKSKARLLNIPLFTKAIDIADRDATLCSLGCAASFEYEDGDVGVTSGVYQLFGKSLQ